jgi:rhamnulokinase
LCQFTADATARLVLAGPVEATAIGNVMTQALAHGEVASPADIRRFVAASFKPARYEPRSAAEWADARERFSALPAQDWERPQ